MSAHSTNPVLMTDHYEYTMLDALVLSGKVNEKAVFEVFSRDLKERSYGVFAGLLPLMETIEKFTFR
jgi:nicotinic acid phosphoribosyltransferase